MSNESKTVAQTQASGPACAVKPESFTPGQEVFLDDGGTVEYVTRLDGEHVVRLIYDHEDYEPSFGKPFTVSHVYAKPPVERRRAEVAELADQATALSDQITKSRRELSEIDREIRGRQDRLRQHGVLDTLDNWIAGKISHLLVIYYSDVLRLFTVEDAAKADRTYGDLSLLVLKGRHEDGLIRWSFQSRYEGMLPFTSAEAARERALQHLETRAKMWREGRTDVNPGGLFDSYTRLALPMPDDIAAKAAETAAANATARLDRARKELAAAEAALSSATTPDAVTKVGG